MERDPARPDHRVGEGRKTLTRWTIDNEHESRAALDNRAPDANGEFSGLLNAVATAVKITANQVNKGALVDPRRSDHLQRDPEGAGLELDGISNDVMIAQTEWTGALAAVASKVMEDVYAIPPSYRRGRHLLVFDPLDGSGNMDLNSSVGTIFSVLRCPTADDHPQAGAFLQAGTEQVCAGFALYGPSTVLILTTGSGVDGFTLDRDIGAFILTHPQMRIPGETSEFAINSSNERFWEPPVRRYVQECLAGRTGPRGKDFNTRWVASLVADTFRILTRGGVFLHPADSKDPDMAGQLRLLHEANPIGFIIEQAGGRASTGRSRLLEVVPHHLHQRVPLIFGSRSEVERIERYHGEASGDDFDASLFNDRSLFHA